MSAYGTLTAALLALIWGAIWAACLQFTDWGQFLAERRTWFTVVVGIGVDLLLFLPLVSLDIWFQLVLIVTASSVAIVARSLYNELQDSRGVQDLLRRITDGHGHHTDLD